MRGRRLELRLVVRVKGFRVEGFRSRVSGKGSRLLDLKV